MYGGCFACPLLECATTRGLQMLFEVSAAAALIGAAARSLPAAAFAGGAALALQRPAVAVLRANNAPFLRAAAALCVSLTLAFKHLPLVLAPSVVVIVFFPVSGAVSAVIAAAGCIYALLRGTTPLSLAPPGGVDVLVAVCAALCLAGTSWHRGLVACAWGVVLQLAPPVVAAAAVAASAAQQHADAWALIERELVHAGMGISPAAQVFFVLSYASMAAAAATVKPDALAAAYVLAGFAMCCAVTATVVLGPHRAASLIKF